MKRHDSDDSPVAEKLQRFKSFRRKAPYKYGYLFIFIYLFTLQFRFDTYKDLTICVDMLCSNPIVAALPVSAKKQAQLKDVLSRRTHTPLREAPIGNLPCVNKTILIQF